MIDAIDSRRKVKGEYRHEVRKHRTRPQEEAVIPVLTGAFTH